jgi:hypothetical protein
VKVADAQLRMADPTVVNVSLTNTTGHTESYRFETEPIVYDTGDGRIVYVNGAVFREDAGGAVAVRRTEFVVNESRVLLPVVATRSREGSAAVGGTTTVLVRASTPGGQRESFGLEAIRTEETDVTLNVTTPRPAAWQRELTRHAALDAADCPVYGDTVSCTLTTQRVYVQRTLVDITFE